MAKHDPRSGKKKRSKPGGFFLRGIVTLLPVVLTVVIIVLVINFVRSYVTQPINNTIYWALESNGLGWRALRLVDVEPYNLEYLRTATLPVSPVDIKGLGERQGYDSDAFKQRLAEYRRNQQSFFRDFDRLAIDRDLLRVSVRGAVPPWVGLVLSLALVLWLGWLASGFVGRRIVVLLDRKLNRIPGVRSVYPYSKQFTEFVFGESKLEFDTVVAVPYPSEGLWSVGFVTNRALRDLREYTGKDMVAVFVPSSPMPMTGYTIFVEAKRLMPLPISVDEALRVTVSGGVLIPPSQAVEGTADDLRAALRLPARGDEHEHDEHDEHEAEHDPPREERA